MRGSRCDGARDKRLRDEQQHAFAVNAIALVALGSLSAVIAGFVRQ